MGYAFDLDDVAFLRSEAGRDALAALADRPLSSASRLTDVTAARDLAGARFASAALETAVLRRRAESKLDNAREWLFTADALQQATTATVARHRARRLTGRDVHDVTCSIGADLREIAAVADRCIGSDLDEVRLAMARHNLGPGVALARADALRPVSTGTAIVADPARRDDAGRRRWNPADLVPPLDELLEVHAGRDVVVKCAPGLDFDAIPGGAEIEIVSLAGQVREAAVWLGGLADPEVRRRATVLRADGGRDELTDDESDECPVLDAGEWIVDPDGAVVRAGLVRQYAARHGLAQLDPRIAYLTGDRPPPGVRAFRVLDHGRYSEKTLRSLLRRHDVGRLEIMARGVDIDPDALRRKLKPRGAAEATVVLTRIGSTPFAYLCRAERT
ncbi:class I SAM-dependent methyltransferase [Saccharopolyspora sp. HNM0986]|uniref:THUMP-like domain-containing protein n=1 Tax=Saccharopolyspora galaxeae TaxID=2781241 RepID=UPI00190D42E9|nr:class I SAM-dependent methyltransferase [Saccharopolyspora sp. HNM0986]MBK0867611.1 class I SAM-dependent methyltransferase [Saccharopolyspora sp. HNM0986]